MLNGPWPGGPGQSDASPALQPPGLVAFCRALEARSGLFYGPEKAYLFESRLRDVFDGPVPSYLELARLLSVDAAVSARVVEALVTSETYFFRDEGTFRALSELVGHAHAPLDGPLVVWSIGCATGQELYSVLLGLEEVAPGLAATVRAYGLDLSAAAIARAQAARYSDFELARGLTPALLERYFERDGRYQRLRSPWRDRATWLQANVLAELPAHLPSPHLIFCRNILIYFSEANKQRVLARLAERLAPGGLIVLGGTENILGCPGLEAVGPECPNAYGLPGRRVTPG